MKRKTGCLPCELAPVDDLIQKVCSENASIALYIGELKKSQHNRKIKALKPLLNQHPNVRRSSENPTIYVWLNENDRIELRQGASQTDKTDVERVYENHLEESSDAPDTTDAQKQKDGIKNTRTAAVISDTLGSTNTNDGELGKVASDAACLQEGK